MHIYLDEVSDVLRWKRSSICQSIILRLPEAEFINSRRMARLRNWAQMRSLPIRRSDSVLLRRTASASPIYCNQRHIEIDYASLLRLCSVVNEFSCIRKREKNKQREKEKRKKRRGDDRSLIAMGMKQGVALENSTSTSQQDLQSYPQQPAPAATATSHSPTAGHYIYQQPHSPVPPQSPVSMSAGEIDRSEDFYTFFFFLNQILITLNAREANICLKKFVISLKGRHNEFFVNFTSDFIANNCSLFDIQKTSQTQQQQQHQQSQLNSLGSYRSTQSVSRPSPQSSPSLTVEVRSSLFR